MQKGGSVAVFEIKSFRACDERKKEIRSVVRMRDTVRVLKTFREGFERIWR